MALGYPKSSPAFVVNSVALAVTFFACRIAAMPPYWRTVYNNYGTPAFNRLGHIQTVLIVTCAILDIINLYWFYKIFHGAMRMVDIILKPKINTVKQTPNGIDLREGDNINIVNNGKPIKLE